MADLKVHRPIYACPCVDCRCCPQSEVAKDHAAINRVVALLNERQRRLFAGLLARTQGHGGIVAVAQITGLSRTTIRRGIAELRQANASHERIRERGGGRKPLEKNSRPW
jgi:DNA-binding phage protein